MKKTIEVTGVQFNSKIKRMEMHYILRTYHHNGTTEERGVCLVGEEIQVTDEESKEE